MRVYSYVIPRDYGFAPNPFHGVCTLGTCMWKIRKYIKEGDWVIGTGSAQYKEREITGHLVYAMKVSEIMSFDDYWNDPRFQCKKPNLRASFKYRMGDNIYHHANGSVEWSQEDSHHSCVGGAINKKNVNNDTGKTTNVLIASRFAYWGHDAITIPAHLRDFEGFDIVIGGRSHKCIFPDQLVCEFFEWFEGLNVQGVIGTPAMFLKSAKWNSPGSINRHR